MAVLTSKAGGISCSCSRPEPPASFSLGRKVVLWMPEMSPVPGDCVWGSGSVLPLNPLARPLRSPPSPVGLSPVNPTWEWKDHPSCLPSPPKGFPGGSDAKESACSAGDPVGSLGQEDPWRREWLPTPVFLPRESHGQRSRAGYSQ